MIPAKEIGRNSIWDTSTKFIRELPLQKLLQEVKEGAGGTSKNGCKGEKREEEEEEAEGTRGEGTTEVCHRKLLYLAEMCIGLHLLSVQAEARPIVSYVPILCYLCWLMVLCIFDLPNCRSGGRFYF